MTFVPLEAYDGQILEISFFLNPFMTSRFITNFGKRRVGPHASFEKFRARDVLETIEREAKKFIVKTPQIYSKVCIFMF